MRRNRKIAFHFLFYFCFHKSNHFDMILFTIYQLDYSCCSRYMKFDVFVWPKLGKAVHENNAPTKRTKYVRQT